MNTLFHFKASGIQRLLNLYFSVQVSREFVSCADTQLTNLFEKDTGLKLNQGIWMGWEKEFPLDYQKGIVSGIKSLIYFKYGSIGVEIKWKSKTGNIYELSDTKINCNDIEFWLEGLDVDRCKKLMFPKWTLLTFKDSIVNSFKRIYNIHISFEFLECADVQLTSFFERMTGTKINKEISLELASMPYNENFSIGIKSSELISILYINHNWNPVIIKWTSKSGHQYQLDEIVIDCTDIIFEFKIFDIELYLKQLKYIEKLPFLTKNLSYELIVNRLAINCTLTMSLIKQCYQDSDNIIEKIYYFTSDYNAMSEKKNRQFGVVHNSRAAVEQEGTIAFEFDLGSAGFTFLEKLLIFINDMKCVDVLEFS